MPDNLYCDQTTPWQGVYFFTNTVIGWSYFSLSSCNLEAQQFLAIEAGHDQQTLSKIQRIKNNSNNYNRG